MARWIITGRLWVGNTGQHERQGHSGNATGAREVHAGDHTDHVLALLLGLVLELEALGQLKVQLNGGALERGAREGVRLVGRIAACVWTRRRRRRTATHLVATAQGVVNLNVNLGAVKGAVSGVQLPLVAKGVERRLERLLGPGGGGGGGNSER